MYLIIEQGKNVLTRKTEFLNIFFLGGNKKSGLYYEYFIIVSHLYTFKTIENIHNENSSNYNIGTLPHMVRILFLFLLLLIIFFIITFCIYLFL